MTNEVPNIVALVPMRHESQRVKGKNYRKLGDRPLYHHIVESLLGCPLISQVVIDTDSPLIMEDVPRVFPNVMVIHRPEHLRDGHTSMNDVLIHDVANVSADYYLQTHSTNPLLTTDTINRGVRQFLAHRDQYDSLFGVTRIQTRLWDHEGSPVNHNPGVLLRTQDLPPIYEENSNLYLFTAESLVTRRNRIGASPMMFEIDRSEAWDIDEELDWQIVELLFTRRQQAEELASPSRQGCQG